jgi:hypothetical protein
MKIRVRTLRIGAREFKWTAELCGYYDIDRDYHRCVRVRAWGGGKNGRRLRVDLESTAPGAWGGVPDCAYPAPRSVRAIIDYALEHDWDPAAIGGCDELGTDAAVEIPGFRITGLLRNMQHLRY